jgi:hypothetical protein
MSIHIIDNKKIDCTNDEWKMYQEICSAYDMPPTRKGKDLFIDLFESDDNGIILFLKPPRRQTSYEVIFYLMCLMQNQHLRLMYKVIDDKFAELNKKLDDKLKEIEDKSEQKDK